MNNYKKYCPNVFVAQCEEKHEKGDTIIVETKYGKKNECVVHNFVGYTGTKENPMYCYSITAQSFDKKEVLLARMKGYKTYNKTVLCAEMPISIYEDLCIRDDDQELLSKEEAQERTNEYVWHQSVKFLDNIKDEVFEIEGGISSLHITNVRKWTEENTIMQHV